MRRGVPKEVGETRAWISTSIGREPSTVATTAEPGEPASRSDRKSADGLGDGLQAGARHLEDADLGDRAEAVLDRAHDAVVLVLLALEVEHGVHDVLERLRARPGCRPW